MTGKSQTIFRVASRHKPYSQLGNAMLRDSRLSIEARGTLSFILSHPVDWKFNIEWLGREIGVGRQKAQRIVRDLVEHGYCIRHQHRDGRGRLGLIEYEFSDEPNRIAPQVENQPTDTQHLVSPQDDLPRAVQPPTVNHPVYKEGQSQRNKSTKDKSGSEVLASPDGQRFDRNVVLTLERLGVDVGSLIDRYRQKTGGKHIADPSAYLMAMGQEEAAKAHGVTIEQIKGSTSRNVGQRQAAAVSATHAAAKPNAALTSLLTQANERLRARHPKGGLQ